MHNLGVHMIDLTSLSQADSSFESSTLTLKVAERYAPFHYQIYSYIDRQHVLQASGIFIKIIERPVLRGQLLLFFSI